MPRLPPSILRHARNKSPLLGLLLQTCRTLPSAQNELRWLREHVSQKVQSENLGYHAADSILLGLCQQRAKGVPLQYLLGSQPFGDLDILCRPGVLIPRSETEASTSHLAGVIQKAPWFNTSSQLSVLDLCTGTGCIPLLLHALLHLKVRDVEMIGIDIFQKALNLAHENVEHNISLGHLPSSAAHQISFMHRNILQKSFTESEIFKKNWDVVTSNPPYISKEGFNKNTTRSVRTYEPKIALVPSEVDRNIHHPEDTFYPVILRVASVVGAKMVLMEVADTAQALRVARCAADSGSWGLIEIWADWPDQTREAADYERDAVLGDFEYNIIGAGHGRSVVCRT